MDEISDLWSSNVDLTIKNPGFFGIWIGNGNPNRLCPIWVCLKLRYTEFMAILIRKTTILRETHDIYIYMIWIYRMITGYRNGQRNWAPIGFQNKKSLRNKTLSIFNRPVSICHHSPFIPHSPLIRLDGPYVWNSTTNQEKPKCSP